MTDDITPIDRTRARRKQNESGILRGKNYSWISNRQETKPQSLPTTYAIVYIRVLGAKNFTFPKEASAKVIFCLNQGGGDLKLKP